MNYFQHQIIEWVKVWFRILIRLIIRVVIILGVLVFIFFSLLYIINKLN
jgi:hypothetical protein